MSRNIPIACLGLVFLCAFGCGDGKKAPVTVKGMVSLDGKPMPDGEISFAVPGEPASILPIKDGAFSGNAPAGPDRVEVRAFKAGPPLSTDPKGPPTKINYIPEQYNGQSKLTADVKAGGANDFKFEVQSR